MKVHKFSLNEGGKWLTPSFASKPTNPIGMFYSKVIPIDANYIYIVGGSKNSDFKAKTIKEPDFSLYLVDMEKKEVISRRKMQNYRNHCAVALFKKKVLYIVGGEFNGEWSDIVSSVDISQELKV